MDATERELRRMVANAVKAGRGDNVVPLHRGPADSSKRSTLLRGLLLAGLTIVALIPSTGFAPTIASASTSTRYVADARFLDRLDSASTQGFKGNYDPNYVIDVLIGGETEARNDRGY